MPATIPNQVLQVTSAALFGKFGFDFRLLDPQLRDERIRAFLFVNLLR